MDVNTHMVNNNSNNNYNNNTSTNLNEAILRIEKCLCTIGAYAPFIESKRQNYS